jgi:2-polyprenyl-3-methyl-5-hydroxy-6-metoxy-1,4-benzoquinol methylase
MPVDEQRLQAFLGQAVGDLGAAVSAVLVSIGDELGFYKALADGPLTAAELAAKTATNERYVREWLSNQAAGGYVGYDSGNGTFFLSAEQALCLADPGGPYNTSLLNAWLPALDGAVDKLARGARVADVGCGHGASTILMAQAFPRSTFVGFDYHDSSTEIARQRATAAGLSNARFDCADAVSYDGGPFDVIAFFDCLHDMADPAGAARHARESLRADGHVMVVEPFANDRLEDNLNPVGRVYYGASTLVCVPVSLAKNGPALGAQAGEARLREVLSNQGGFSRVRRAAETPFNIVLEARP